MSWIADQNTGRTYDPDTGYELTVLSGGSDGSATFKVYGPGVEYQFSAEKVFPRLSVAERDRLGVSTTEEIVVWRVNYVPPELEPAITGAFLAIKSGRGFHYPDSVYFVQFGHRGDLRNG